MTAPNLITAQVAADIRAREDRLNRWLNGRNCYKLEDVPADARLTNEERSALELYDFCTDPPARYFLYIRMDDDKGQGFYRQGIATTWMGDMLGRATFGPSWRSNFGDHRRAVRIRAVNGRTYVGTYYYDAGDYARVRAVREKGKD